MPKELAADLIDRLADKIARHPKGVSPKALFEPFSREASPRSLARIIKRLARAGRIVDANVSRARDPFHEQIRIHFQRKGVVILHRP